MGIADDIVAEHRRIADTMLQVGADAPAGVGSWTVADLAAHLVSQTMGGGVVVFLGRYLVARGVRLNDRAGGATERTIAYYRRRGFDSAIDRLRAGVPRPLLRPSVARCPCSRSGSTMTTFADPMGSRLRLSRRHLVPPSSSHSDFSATLSARPRSIDCSRTRVYSGGSAADQARCRHTSPSSASESRPVLGVVGRWAGRQVRDS